VLQLDPADLLVGLARAHKRDGVWILRMQAAHDEKLAELRAEAARSAAAAEADAAALRARVAELQRRLAVPPGQVPVATCLSFPLCSYFIRMLDAQARELGVNSCQSSSSTL